MNRSVRAALLLLALALSAGCELTQRSCHDVDGSGVAPQACQGECLKNDKYLRCQCSAKCPCLSSPGH
ncbi:MAG TPA: hypothetical protein VE981_24610 [Planctomycetota bacterium]|nr:hypothetical protein [Planctomycetota bacterium]